METKMKLLKELYKVHSPSRHEEPMRKFLKKYIGNIGGTKVEEDKVGNLLVTKGASKTYPCIVAHMDEVHTVRPRRFKVVVYQDNYILGGDAEILRPCGIGADDKNGVWIALKLLERFDAVKAAFFVGEEVGCIGSHAVDMKFFDDVRFVLQCDRKGGSDFVDTIAGTQLCSTAFKSAMKIDDFGYKVTTGLSTDVETLKERGLAVSCCNMSCGYYNPHTIDEYTDFVELENCLDMCSRAFATITDVQKHKYVRKYDLPSYSSQSRYGFNSYMSQYNHDDDSTDMQSRGGYSKGWYSRN